MTEAVQPVSSKKRLRRRLWLTLLAYLCLMSAVFLYYSESAHRVLFGQLAAVEFVVTDATTGAPVYAQVNLEIDGGPSPMSTSVSPDEAGRAVFLRSDEAEALHRRLGRMVSTRFGLRWLNEVTAYTHRYQAFKGDPKSMKVEDLGWSEEKNATRSACPYR
jgi:hypothetical protein